MNKKIVLLLPIVFVLTIVMVIFATTSTVSSSKSTKELEAMKTVVEAHTELQNNYSSEEKWAEGTITYGAKHYLYNSKLKNYLLMGIDIDDVVKTAPDYQSGGQADSLFLLVANPDEMTGKIVAINRNTWTDLQMYEKDGTSLGTHKGQICAQHGFGDGRKLSCNMTSSAVSNLFYNIPIEGYLAINVGCIPDLNDFVGGVELEVLPGTESNAAFKGQTGERVHLDGQQAYHYMKNRDVEKFASADDRQARIQQYLCLFLPKFSEIINKDPMSVLSLYQTVSPYLETNMDAEEVMTELASYNFDEEHMLTIPGETIMADTGYEEYHVDEEAFYKMVIDVFYNEVE